MIRQAFGPVFKIRYTGAAERQMSDNRDNNVNEIRLTGIGPANIECFRPLFLSDPNPGEIAVGAIFNGFPAGVGFYDLREGGLVLTYIFVHPDYRRRGIGTSILSAMCEACAEAGLGSVYACFFDIPDLEKLLAGNGFMMTQGDKVLSVSLDTETAERIGRFSHLAEGIKSRRIIRLDEPEPYLRQKLYMLAQSMEAAGYSSEILLGGQYNPKLSFAVTDESEANGKITAVLLADEEEHDGTAIIKMVFSISEKASDYRLLLIGAHERVRDFFCGKGELIFVLADERVETLVHRLFGKQPKKKGNIIRAIRYSKTGENNT